MKTSSALALLAGIIYMFLSMYVQHQYEEKYGRKALSSWIQVWPFFESMKKEYPSFSVVGRTLVVITAGLTLPLVLRLIVGS